MTYSKIGGEPHSGCKIFNGSRFYGVIDGLLPFTVYALNVSASTVKGQGPASPAITVKTEEEGRGFLVSLLRVRVRNESPNSLHVFLPTLCHCVKMLRDSSLCFVQDWHQFCSIRTFRMIKLI